jgi:GT2 family glycosyltransferase
MDTKISVVIRNKNQAVALDFLLKNLNSRYKADIDEIIVIDNLSTDSSEQIIKTHNAKLVSIEKFSYGGSANLAAQSAKNDIVVIFSAHAYPVSHDFFKQIIQRFEINKNLAGLRCIHNKNDYKNYINNISSIDDPNVSGLIFCGSAFSKKVWQKHKFKDDITTFEDKEWSLRVLKHGFEIEFSPSVFCYEISRSSKQNFFRFKNETIGSYQLWHKETNVKLAFKNLFFSLLGISRNSIIVIFLSNKPKKF